MPLFNSGELGGFVYIIKQENIISDEEAAQMALDSAASLKNIVPNTTRGRLEGFLTGGSAVDDPDRDPKTPPQNLDVKDVLILSATEKFSKNERGKTTNFPIGGNRSVSDHYTSEGADLNFSGVIGPKLFLALFSTVINSISKTPEAYVEKVKDFFHSSTSNLVTIYFPDGTGETNCVLTQFKIEREAKVGDGFKVDVTARRIKVANSNTGVITKQPANDTSTFKKDASTKTTEKLNGDKLAADKESLIVTDAGLSVKAEEARQKALLKVPQFIRRAGN
jgi:hypothetical protein